MERQEQEQQLAEFYCKIDPQLSDIEGTTVQAGSQFDDQPVFDPDYVQEEAQLGHIQTHVDPSLYIGDAFPQQPQQRIFGAAAANDAMYGCLDNKHCIATSTQEQYSIHNITTPTSIPLRLQPQMLATPPDSSSPYSHAHGTTSMLRIALSSALQQPPALSIDTDQALAFDQHNIWQGRATLSPWNALTPTSQASWQPPGQSSKSYQTPSTRARPRAKSTIGLGTAELMHEAIAEQAAMPDISAWVHDHINHTDQPGPSQRTAHQHPPPMLMHSVSAPVSVASYKCPAEDCDREFPTKSGMDHHKRYHEARGHLCNECQQAFHFRKDLRRHRSTVHSDVAQFMCQVAECKYNTKGFKRPDHWKRHMHRMHGWVFEASSRRGSRAEGQLM